MQKNREHLAHLASTLSGGLSKNNMLGRVLRLENSAKKSYQRFSSILKIYIEDKYNV